MRAGSVGFSASGGRPLILAVLCVGGEGRLLYQAVVVVAECEDAACAKSNEGRTPLSQGFLAMPEVWGLAVGD
jgi:hypothetical protein